MATLHPWYWVNEWVVVLEGNAVFVTRQPSSSKSLQAEGFLDNN